MIINTQLKLKLGISILSCFVLGCTGQIPGSFRFLQQEQKFGTKQEINTKIDLLWVVDNSSSMDASQEKLRKGFQKFAAKYMKPTWDIRVAAITTDTYLANSAFSTYLNTVVPGSVGYKSTYISSRLSTFQNPSWNPNFINLSTGKMDSGLTFGNVVPLWGPNYSRLIAGVHDGPITALCFEGMPYFIKGDTSCKIRDDQTKNTGISNCINPNTSAGESSLSQCVNTVENDTVRSGKAIISTLPGAGVAADESWTNQLIQSFMVNLSTGSSGHNSERGMSSVLQLLNDNESTDTAFFRKGSLRGIIFVTDEDDQSMTIPSSPASTYKPDTDYMCDQASLLSSNSASLVTGSSGYCCTDSSKNCKYGALGTSCPSKTVDGYTYTLSICADSSKLISVDTVKSSLDQFFQNLDGQGSDSNYFIASIVPTSATAIQNIQAARTANDTSAGVIKTIAVDRGDRYIALGQAVGADSLVLDISSDDYSPILDAIGQQIVLKKSTFTLDRAPTGQEDMLITLVHQDGSQTIVSNSYYVIQGKSIVFTDQDFVLSFASTDQILINYQPKTAK